MPNANNANVTPQDAAQWLSSGEAILIDVREPDEFKDEHISCAASVPLASVRSLFQQMHIPPGRKVIFQCVKGGRGEQACRMASDAAAEHPVYNLAGGIDAWKQAGLPVSGAQAAAGTRISIFRQVQIGAGLLVALSVVAGFSGYRVGFALAGFFGLMLAIVGTTGWCGMALVLARMPWNKPA